MGVLKAEILVTLPPLLVLGGEMTDFGRGFQIQQDAAPFE